MTPQVTINVLEKLKTVEGQWIINGHFAEDAIDEAIKALEKQIPQKPIFEHNEKYDMDVVRCPVCKVTIASELNKVQHFYCVACGQAIDWSDTE